MALTGRELLVRNREQAMKLVNGMGKDRMQKVLAGAERDLLARMKSAGSGSFTAEQAKVALAQVRAVLKDVQGGIKETAVEGAKVASEKAVEGQIDYLNAVDQQFKGIVQPLALDEAAMFERGMQGAKSSLLARLASSGEPVVGADAVPHKAKVGILERYGMNTFAQFEDIFQKGVLTKASWTDMRSQITEVSPFLQGAPMSWSTRIVRTEVMSAYNKASWESTREADDQLGDMVKIVSSVVDDRTGSDSISLHAQIRRVDEAFETWYGLMQHPPDRPNDRGLVVPHRIAWPIPDYLQPFSDAQVLARWRMEKRKGQPPPRGRRSTIPIERFGRG